MKTSFKCPFSVFPPWAGHVLRALMDDKTSNRCLSFFFSLRRTRIICKLSPTVMFQGFKSHRLMVFQLQSLACLPPLHFITEDASVASSPVNLMSLYPSSISSMLRDAVVTSMTFCTSPSIVPGCTTIFSQSPRRIGRFKALSTSSSPSTSSSFKCTQRCFAMVSCTSHAIIPNFTPILSHHQDALVA